MADSVANKSHKYGLTTIGDRANAILGNSYRFGDDLHITEATIVICDNTSPQRSGLIAGIKRRLQDDSVDVRIPSHERM